MVIWPVEFHRLAIREATAARRWYAKRSPKAARRFLAELDRAVSQVGTFPDSYPAYLLGTRYFLFRRFPYLLVYRLAPDRVEAIAVAHAHRRPGYWRRRLEHK